MKIYNVTFNNGSWYSGRRPSFQVVAENKQEAIDKVLEEYPFYKSDDVCASEFKIEGYVIEVYDKKTYKRNKKLKKILDN